MRWLLFFGLLLALLILGLLGWRALDRAAERREIARLRGLQPAQPARFDPTMVADLPAPAQRFFNFTFTPGAPLARVAQFEMVGQLGLGDRSAPGYMPMRAVQILAAPEGFVWQLRAGTPPMRVVGSDSGHWTRFWLGGLMPVARAGGHEDHHRSAFGRMVIEALILTPGLFLPGPNIQWRAVNETQAAVTLTHGTVSQELFLQVDAAGMPERVWMMRWSDANPAKTFQMQPFGGLVSAPKRFGEVTLMTHMEVGNHYGTPDWFPFFIADITSYDTP